MNYVIQKKPIPKLFDDNGDFMPGVHYSKAWYVVAETPESAWPDIVYKRNAIEGGYEEIGIYRTTETKSTQWFNSRTNHWEGTPSVKIYTFIPTPL